MMGAIIALHVTICILLILIILIQAGRGGGLVESFSNVESVFGTKTSTFLTRATTILSVSFFITCLSLAFLSARQSRSLIRNFKAQERVTQKNTVNEPAGTTTPQQPQATEQSAQPGKLPPAQELPTNKID